MNQKEIEAKWQKYWEENNIYEFKPDERKIYSIDTPPPTVNGKIHIGHIFSYTQSTPPCHFLCDLSFDEFSLTSRSLHFLHSSFPCTAEVLSVPLFPEHSRKEHLS